VVGGLGRGVGHSTRLRWCGRGCGVAGPFGGRACEGGVERDWLCFRGGGWGMRLCGGCRGRWLGVLGGGVVGVGGVRDCVGGWGCGGGWVVVGAGGGDGGGGVGSGGLGGVLGGVGSRGGGWVERLGVRAAARRVGVGALPSDFGGRVRGFGQGGNLSAGWRLSGCGEEGGGGGGSVQVGGVGVGGGGLWVLGTRWACRDSGAWWGGGVASE